MHTPVLASLVTQHTYKCVFKMAEVSDLILRSPVHILSQHSSFFVLPNHAVGKEMLKCETF